MPTARTSTARTSTARTMSDARTSFALGIEPAVPADTRPKRKAAAAPGALAEPALVNSSRSGQRGPGTGCAAVLAVFTSAPPTGPTARPQTPTRTARPQTPTRTARPQSTRVRTHKPFTCTHMPVRQARPHQDGAHRARSPRGATCLPRDSAATRRRRSLLVQADRAEEDLAKRDDQGHAGKVQHARARAGRGPS